ncbi:helix-turn-helix domain-containing protein [Acidithiobacillus sp. MC6.1]|nr:helix-turn-helix domain-containing protein [Acidithiobacillus sp. MC6.1]
MNISHLIFVAVHIAGSQTNLARQVGVSPQAVHEWLKGGSISPRNAIAIERATNGAVTGQELRPDIFGPLAGLPDHTPVPQPPRPQPGQTTGKG